MLLRPLSYLFAMALAAAPSLFASLTAHAQPAKPEMRESCPGLVASQTPRVAPVVEDLSIAVSFISRVPPEFLASIDGRPLAWLPLARGASPEAGRGPRYRGGQAAIGTVPFARG